MYSEVLKFILAEIAGLNLYHPGTLGALETGNSIAVQLGPGAPSADYYDRGQEVFFYVIVNGKHTNSTTALNALTAIHKRLTRLKSYPKTAEYNVLTIRTSSTPGYVAFDASSKQWYYGSTLKITVYIKGGT